MKHKKKSTMFTNLDLDEHNKQYAFDITNANFKFVEKALKKQDDQNFNFDMRIDSLRDWIENELNNKNSFRFNLRHLADTSKKLAEIVVFPALLSIIYYCFK